MKVVDTICPEIKLVGIRVRTNNQDEFDPEKENKIADCAQKYFAENLATQIPNRFKPGVTFCAYTDYDSNEHGCYTFFIGEQVSSTDEVPKGLSSLVIPAQSYKKFTTDPGPMPSVIQEAWKEIWSMNVEKLGAKRSYQADFELYDERAADPNQAVADIFIGIEK